MNIRSTIKATAALGIALASFAPMTGTAAASGYENTLSAAWGKTEHSFERAGAAGATGELRVRLTDRDNDGDCVYVKAKIRVNNGPDYTRDIGRVCGKGESRRFNFTFRPVANTRIRGVDVTMCKEDLGRDTCITEYNGA